MRGKEAGELAERLVSWVKEQVATAGARGVVVGMSGGIDSSVAAVLGKRAFPDGILGLLLPCHSSLLDLEHACLVARQFLIPTALVSLDAVFDTLLQALPADNMGPAPQRIAEANLKPRLRMLTLYYSAKRLNYLVMGTSNRSEIAIGYFTKYGDGGSDIAPLGNLVKQQVKELALHLGIPREIRDKPPSAGLWEGQTDEMDMGITYAELDHYLLGGEARAGVKSRIEQMVAQSAHKRRLPLIPP